MDYKNFSLRLLFSIILILIYYFIAKINFKLVFFLVLFIYFLIFIEILIYFKKFKLVPLIYILISFIFFINIDFSKEQLLNFNFFIFIVICFDISSYVVGKLLGKNKLIKISPKKTVEGLIGGFSLSFLLSLIFSYYLLNTYTNLNLFLFIFMIILTAFLGDILESFFKRKNNIKNSSSFIPGHGGLFDRFDSFLFSIIFYSVSINI